MNCLKSPSSKVLYFLVATSLIALLLAHTCHAQNSAQDYLDAHNTARAADGVAPLAWSATVASFAQQFANRHNDNCGLPIAPETTLLPYAVNWASSSTAILTAADAVGLWVSGKINYDYTTNTCSGRTGLCLAYLQMVWSRSTLVGCGRVRCNGGGSFIACAYSPRGNYLVERPF